MTDTNKLLTINELQEAKYFSDEQKEFLKDYQFSYILQGYQDISMQTDDDCGHSITKIAVVENKGCGDIKDIGTISIEITTFCYDDLIPTLFGNDDVAERYISSNNIKGFPSHYSKTTENMFNDNRKEVFDKLGILDDAEKWFREKYSTEEVGNDAVSSYIKNRFRHHIFCDKCKSIIHSSHWKNHGLWRTHEMQGVGEEAVEVEREYFDMECPICKEHKEVDANEHIELYNDTIADEIIDTNTSDNPFDVSDNPFDVSDDTSSTFYKTFETPDEILNKFTDGEVISYAELIRRLPNHFAFREKLLAIPNHMSLSDKYHVVKLDKCIQLDYVGVLEYEMSDYVDIKFNEFDIEGIYFCCPEPDDCDD